jgi:hypothetical protein
MVGPGGHGLSVGRIVVGYLAPHLATLLAVQWPFSVFLLSDAADNRFFARDDRWGYSIGPGPWMNGFWDAAQDPLSFHRLGVALVVAFVSARLGIWLGNYLRGLKR